MNNVSYINIAMHGLTLLAVAVLIPLWNRLARTADELRRNDIQHLAGRLDAIDAKLAILQETWERHMEYHMQERRGG